MKLTRLFCLIAFIPSLSFTMELSSLENANLQSMLKELKRDAIARMVSEIEQNFENDIRFIQGAHFYAKLNHVTTIKDEFTGESQETKGPLPEGELEQFKTAYFDQIHAKHFSYNMKKGFNFSEHIEVTNSSTDSKRLLIEATSGLQDVGNDQGTFAISEFINHQGSVKKSKRISTKVASDIEGEEDLEKGKIAHVTLSYSYILKIYTRHKEYLVTGKIVPTVPNRQLNGGIISYERMGPGFMQTFMRTADLSDSKYEIEPLISGDYRIKVDNIFCGCEAIIDEDKVFNPYGEDGLKHILEFKLVNAKVRGRVVVKGIQQDHPVSGKIMELIPACMDSADPCMSEVEKVETDEEGYFEFPKVPKGVYRLLRDGEEIKKVTFCDFEATDIDLGSFTIVPQYDVYADFNVKGLAKGAVVWRGITIGFLNINGPLHYLEATTAESMEHWIDTLGNPLAPPYQVLYNGAPAGGGAYSLPYYFSLASDPYELPEVLSVQPLVEGGFCYISQEEDSLNAFSIDGDDQYAFILPSIDLFCGESEDDSIQMTIDVDYPDWGSTFKNRPLSTSEIDSLLSMKTFNYTFTGERGTLKLRFEPLSNGDR